jgi:hypothetical protein
MAARLAIQLLRLPIRGSSSSNRHASRTERGFDRAEYERPTLLSCGYAADRFAIIFSCCSRESDIAT